MIKTFNTKPPKINFTCHAKLRTSISYTVGVTI